MSTHAVRTYGPSALGGSSRRFLELTLTLARTEFKLRYFGSALGYLWSLMRPLLFFGVIYVVFTQIFKIGAGVPHYGVYLLTGIVLWTYFAEATGGCVTSLVGREAMLRKVRFPRMVIPLSVSLTSAFNLGMNFIAVIVFALVNGVPPTILWLEMIPIAFGFVVLATGVGMLLSALYVRFRDMQPIWEVTAQILFYVLADHVHRQPLCGDRAHRAAQSDRLATDPDGLRVHPSAGHGDARRPRDHRRPVTDAIGVRGVGGSAPHGGRAGLDPGDLRPGLVVLHQGGTAGRRKRVAVVVVGSAPGSSPLSPPPPLTGRARFHRWFPVRDARSLSHQTRARGGSAPQRSPPRRVARRCRPRRGGHDRAAGTLASDPPAT